MKPGCVVADLAREEDIDEILDLNTLEYGPDDILATRVDFAWRHDQNPAGQAVIPVIRNDQDRVVGFIWVVPLHLRIRGRAYLAAIGTNLLVHPEYRNTFDYAKLIRKFERVFREKDIPLHFSFVSEETFRRLREKNPHTVNAIPVMVRPLDLGAMVKTYYTKKWQRFVLGQIGRLPLPLFFGQRPVACGGEIAVEAVDQFGEEFNQFWHTVEDKYPVMTIRDRAFLAWRFAKVSKRHYHILVARAGDETLGYAVLRCATIRGVKTGLIMDLLVTDGSAGSAAGACLIAEAEAYFRTQGMSVIVGISRPSTSEYDILRRARFLRLPGALAPRVFRFAFFVHTRKLRDLARLSTREWFVTLADYESF